MIYKFDLLEYAAVLYAELVADPTVAATVGGIDAPRIYNYVPENEPHNFIRISQPTFTDDSTKNKEGRWTGNIQLHCFASTEHKGDYELYGMTKALYEKLHNNPIDTDNLQVVNQWVSNTIFVPEPDGRTQHATLTLSFLIKQLTGA